MARTRRFKREQDTYYHLMSRTNAKAHLFDDGPLKDDIADLLLRSAEFSGVDLLAWCLMNNHFHLVCRAGIPEGPVPESEVLRRVAILKGREFADRLGAHWSRLHALNRTAELETELARWRRRMHDVSEFIKTFKELVNIRFKRDNDYVGSIWSGRFTSTVIQDGEYLRTCIRYVELNPVRAHLVTSAADYVWSSASRRAPQAGTDPAGDESKAGTDPAGGEYKCMEVRLFRRIVEIGAGKVFGSREFVGATLQWLGAQFPHRAVARPLRWLEGAYASHGYKLAAKSAQADRTEKAA